MFVLRMIHGPKRRHHGLSIQTQSSWTRAAMAAAQIIDAHTAESALRLSIQTREHNAAVAHVTTREEDTMKQTVLDRAMERNRQKIEVNIQAMAERERALLAEVATLRAALAIYANRDNWSEYMPGQLDVWNDYDYGDGPLVAEAALGAGDEAGENRANSLPPQP